MTIKLSCGGSLREEHVKVGDYVTLFTKWAPITAGLVEEVTSLGFRIGYHELESVSRRIDP
jgi:hypothetical protein